MTGCMPTSTNLNSNLNLEEDFELITKDIVFTWLVL